MTNTETKLLFTNLLNQLVIGVCIVVGLQQNLQCIKSQLMNKSKTQQNC